MNKFKVTNKKIDNLRNSMLNKLIQNTFKPKRIRRENDSQNDDFRKIGR